MPWPPESVTPSNSLPAVVLESSGARCDNDLWVEKFAIVCGSEAVGSCTLQWFDHPSDARMWFDGITVDAGRRGEGIGLATYLLAARKAQRLGLSFETQRFEQSPDAKRIWEHLAAMGLAEVVEPFRPSTFTAGHFTGLYRVPRPSAT